MRACFVEHGKILGFGCGNVHSVKPFGNNCDVVSCNDLCHRASSPMATSGSASRDIRYHDPTTKKSSEFSHVCTTMLFNPALAEYAFMIPNIAESVASWWSPKYHRTPAPAAQTADSGEIRHPSSTQQSADAIKGQSRGRRRPSWPVGIVDIRRWQ